MELTSFERDRERIEDVLAYNNLPKTASILNVNRDPRRTTEKYTETDDVEVIQTLNSHGWNVVNYQEVRPHKASRQGFQKYLAVYENPDFPGTNLGKAQLLQRGSHDGSTKLQIDAGFFTFACVNDLVVGEFLFEPICVKHIGDLPMQIDLALHSFMETCPLVFQKVTEMSERAMSPFEVQQFARKACGLRFRDDKYKINLEDVIFAHHREQTDNTLWNVFNRIQENLLRPKKEFRVTTKDNKKRKVRGITNIDTKVRLNKDLWHLAEEYLVH